MNEELFLAQQMNSTLLATAGKIQYSADQLSDTLTTRQFMALMAISHMQDADATYNNISHKLGTTKQNIKQIVSALEKHGFVTVHSSSSDKRAVNVLLTDSGFNAMKEWSILGNTFLLNMVNRLTEEEINQLWILLRKLYAFDGTEFNGYEQESEPRQT